MLISLFNQLLNNNIHRKHGELRTIILTAFISWILLNMGCKNPITDDGPQPSYLEEVQHKPMLNVFGILRPVDQNELPLSFVHLEKSFPYTTYPDTIEVPDAEVILARHIDSSSVELTGFFYTDFNAQFSSFEYRNPNFFPRAGQTYDITCRKEGFPTLTSKTTIPSIPLIAITSVIITENEITFAIVRDSLAALYDIYLEIGEKEYSVRERRPESGDTQVLIKYDKVEAVQFELKIYAYDLNLSEYITYNISIKPNTYRLPYSTVDNGYGSFGSLNYLKLIIQF